jgi:hypothetical protein
MKLWKVRISVIVAVLMVSLLASGVLPALASNTWD